MDTKLQDSDFRWFLENYGKLFAEYGKSFLAIKNKSVLGKYRTYAEAVEETKKKEELGSFIVQNCNGEESGFTNYISSMNFMGAAG